MGNQDSSKKNKTISSSEKLKNIILFLVVVALLVLISLSPEMYSEYQQNKFAANKVLCFKTQKAAETSVRKFLENNPDKLFSPGTLDKSELISKLVEDKLLPTKPQCPDNAVLRVGSLDLSGDFVISCSIHGSEDRQAGRSGKIVLQTHSGGKLIYDATIVRDQADVMAAYLLSAGVLQDPRTHVTAEVKGDKIQISFKARIDASNAQVFKERTLFHAREISKQIFSGKEIEFKLLPADKSQAIVFINSKQ